MGGSNVRKTKAKLINFLPYAFFIAICFVMFTKEPGSNGDEIWNYSFAKNICEGKLPYTDFNMIPTPLSAYVSAVFMRIFGTSLFVFRAIAVALAAIAAGLLYFLSAKITESKFLPFVATTFASILCMFVWIYNYNHLNLVILLLIMALELYRDGDKHRTAFAMTIWLDAIS